MKHNNKAGEEQMTTTLKIWVFRAERCPKDGKKRDGGFEKTAVRASWSFQIAETLREYGTEHLHLFGVLFCGTY